MTQADKDNMHRIFNEIKKDRNKGLDKLFKLYHRKLYGISYSILKNKDDAEEVLQIVLMKLIKMDSELLPNENEWTWIYSVMKNASINYIRKNKSTYDIDDMYYISSDDNNIENVLDKDRFNRIISCLKEDEKEIVSLKIISDLSFAEISDIVNMPEGTVKWKYYKSLNTVKSMIGSIMAFIISITTYLGYNRKPVIPGHYENFVIGESALSRIIRNIIPTNSLGVVMIGISLVFLGLSLYFTREYFIRKHKREKSKSGFTFILGFLNVILLIIVAVMGVKLSDLKSINDRLYDEVYDIQLQCDELNSTIYELQQEKEKSVEIQDSSETQEVLIEGNDIPMEEGRSEISEINTEDEEDVKEEQDDNETSKIIMGESVLVPVPVQP